jgi:hypothetical protein
MAKDRRPVHVDYDEIHARVVAFEKRHYAFFDPGRRIVSECELCWFVKTMRQLMGQELLARIRELEAETAQMRKQLDDLKNRRP